MLHLRTYFFINPCSNICICFYIHISAWCIYISMYLHLCTCCWIFLLAPPKRGGRMRCMGASQKYPTPGPLPSKQSLFVTWRQSRRSQVTVINVGRGSDGISLQRFPNNCASSMHLLTVSVSVRLNAFRKAKFPAHTAPCPPSSGSSHGYKACFPYQPYLLLWPPP